MTNPYQNYSFIDLISVIKENKFLPDTSIADLGNILPIKIFNERDGILNIIDRWTNFDDWMVSFFNFEDEKNDSVLRLLDSNLDKDKIYKDLANTLEVLWRLHYGVPIFCRY